VSEGNGMLWLNGGSRDFGSLVDVGRWFNQAWNDLLSARNDFEGDHPAPEWVCFKCHQVPAALLVSCWYLTLCYWLMFPWFTDSESRFGSLTARGGSQLSTKFPFHRQLMMWFLAFVKMCELRNFRIYLLKIY